MVLASLQPKVQTIVAIEPEPAEQPGVWLARGRCGHTWHLRHQPPLHSRPELLDAQKRAALIGSTFECRNCAMPELPEGAVELRRSATWTEHEIPKALLSRHDLRADRWARIVVEVGRLAYVIEDVEPPHCFHLKPGFDGIVEPLRPHHIRAQGALRMHIVFYAGPEGALE